jgi:sugar phosphate isomerase/epimerase
MTNPTSSHPFHTRTGNYPIGFRRMGSPWNQDTSGMIAWMAKEGFGVIDLMANAEKEVAQFQKAGIKIGTVDLHEWSDYPLMLSDDKAKREQAVAKAIARIRAYSALGARNYFTLMLTEDDKRSAQETFKRMVEGYGALIPVLEETKSKISIEGWPERQAHCCNPESYRAFFAEVKSPAFGINYDPSHLIRLGIDHVRFLHEFADRVVHVHGKDTEIFTEKLYEMGYEQRLAKLGGNVWRYTIPGHGQARWPAIFQILQKTGYQGAVCIEHEDDVFSGTTELEQQGLIYSAAFLASC